MHRTLGAFLVEEGYIEPHHLRMVLGHRERLRQKPLCEILVERYGLPAAALAEAIREQHESLCRMDHGEHPAPLWTYLVEQGLVAPQTMARALWWQQHLREMQLGEMLVELHILDRDRLEAAVRAQLEDLAVA